MVLFFETSFHAGLPISLAVVDEPVGELLEFYTGRFHDFPFLRLCGIRMSNVLRAHHPVLEVFNGFRGESS
jgi:hypothetical protein